MFKYVVCGKNVALGIFPTMESAIDSVEMSFYDSTLTLDTPHYKEFWVEKGEDNYRVSIVAVKESTGPGQMFR